jgi:hypothetical protein
MAVSKSQYQAHGFRVRISLGKPAFSLVNTFKEDWTIKWFLGQAKQASFCLSEKGKALVLEQDRRPDFH